MGVKWSVLQWVPVRPDRYDYESVYRGRSFIRAVFAAMKARRKYGCVLIEWR